MKTYKIKKNILTVILFSIFIGSSKVGATRNSDKISEPLVRINVLEKFTVERRNYYKDNLLQYIYHVDYKNGAKYSGYLKRISITREDGLYKAVYSGLLELDPNIDIK